MQRRATSLLLSLFLIAVPTVGLGDDVETILKNWARHRADRRVRGIHGTARVYQYDEVFHTETRGRMEFWISGPEEWRVDFAPVDINGLKSFQSGRFGFAYDLKARRHERYSQSATILTTETASPHGPPKRQQVDVGEIAASWRSEEDAPEPGFFQNFARSLATIPLSISRITPGVISLACDGPNPDPASFQFVRREDWDVTLGNTHGQKGRIHLRLHPKSDELQQSFSSLEVLLDASDFRPIGIRLNDPAGTSNVVYAFEQIGAVPYDSDPFGPRALEVWPPECAKPTDGDRPPPPPVASRLVTRRARPLRRGIPSA